jgi:hypothetical protein
MKQLDEFFAHDEIQQAVRYPDDKESSESVVIVSCRSFFFYLKLN